ncbi:MAG: response regulator [Gammaproteobacteria bacterium]|jgi:CheY-like chemotaxis protein
MKDFVTITGSGPVVLVDDDQADAWLLRRCYERSKLTNEFVWIGSGVAFIEYLRGVAAGNSPIPALIMLDLQTAGLDGPHTLKRIESAAHGARPAILALTSSLDSASRDKAERLGADAFRAKPADPAETVDMFNALTDEEKPDPVARRAAH